MDESSLIPYQASELAGARILVLAAHPDDEVLGAGGALALNAGKADAIRVWIATDGARQQGVAGSETAAFGRRRREESLLAAERLGLGPPRFGELPDRELAASSETLGAALASLIEDFQPDLVLCPSPVEIHPDHRALAEALYERVAASRPADPDHDRYRFVRLAFYEISHPLLPNVLVDIAQVADRKEEALAAYVSQQAVRDYAGAVGGLNAYRRLTLEGAGPVEAFRVLDYAEASTRSLEEFRRSIGPAVIRDGDRGPAPVCVVVRTRNRPALVKEALESLRAQTARPRQVVLVNDGGSSLADLPASFRDSFELTVKELPERRGRSAAANAGMAAGREDLVTFLDDDDRSFPDHLERLLRAYRGGPEPVVYSDAVTAVYGRRGEDWEMLHRTLQYSLDFDADFLLFANYIPLHTLLLPRALYTRLNGFDEGLDYSEDWDFLIRLSFETSFRHVRAVTCEYRVFQEREGDPVHVAAGDAAFQEARGKIYERYRKRRTDAGLARVFDRMRAQIAYWYERDTVSQGELRYQRESHRLLDATLRRTGERLGFLEAELPAESARLRAENDAGRRRTAELETETARLLAEEARLRGRVDELQTERRRVLAENEVVSARLAELFAANERYDHELAATRAEIERLNGILAQIFRSRTWKLHLFLERLRGR